MCLSGKIPISVRYCLPSAVSTLTISSISSNVIADQEQTIPSRLVAANADDVTNFNLNRFN